jgi:hypothetical protein
MAPTSKYAFSPNGEEFRCAHPDNTPICQALLNKAAAYPPEKKYNRDATMRAAQKCSELTYSLSSLTWGHWAWSYPPMARTQFGANICHFIQSVVENPPPVKCHNADNQPIYQALVEKAASYPPAEKWAAQAYATAAAGLAAAPESLKVNCYAAYGIPGTGSSTQHFIMETARRIFCPTACRENEPLYNHLHRFGTHIPADARALAAVAQHPTQLVLDQYGTLAAYLPGLTRETRQRIEDFLVLGRYY